MLKIITENMIGSYKNEREEKTVDMKESESTLFDKICVFTLKTISYDRLS